MILRKAGECHDSTKSNLGNKHITREISIPGCRRFYGPSPQMRRSDVGRDLRAQDETSC